MRRIALVALLTLTIPAAARAAGMPQLDFGNPLTTAQAVWLAIIFALLYQALSRWALPRVGELLEARAVAISRDLEAAQQAKTNSDAAVASLTAATKKAHAAAQAEITSAVAVAKESAAARAAELQVRLDAELADAEQHIAEARAAAMGVLREAATETAAVMVARLTGRAAPAAALDAAVGDALAASGQG